jgi:Sec-independent protein secretion pathway component TatC
VFELVTLLLFIALPCWLGYVTASYAAAAIPAVSLVASVISYAVDPPTGTDEIEVLAALWVAFSIAAVVVCLGAATVARRSGRHLRRQAH